jgi:hypothetical protein
VGRVVLRKTAFEMNPNYSPSEEGKWS